MNRSTLDALRLRRSVEWALSRALDPTDVLPLLHRLSRLAPEGTDENVYAQRQLAELLAEAHPWRAALSAKRVLSVHPGDDGAWAILASCHSQLGHYRAAVAAYRRAVDIAPDNPVHTHNLGHLIDVALGRPKEALALLQTAYEGTLRRADVAASYAHALGRAGDLSTAIRVTRRALRGARSQGGRRHAEEHTALLQWLERGAPRDPGELEPTRRAPPALARSVGWTPPPDRKTGSKQRVSRKRPPARSLGALVAVLDRGLERLPLDTRQRERARAIAEDAWKLGAVEVSAEDAPSVDRLAAAIAYAVAFTDHVPLSQADVAGCFRVSVPALRGTFRALRCQLGLPQTRSLVATEKPR